MNRQTEIELTEKQREAVRNGEAIRVSAPEIGEDVVLLRATDYENLKELLSDLREQNAALHYSMGQARTVAKDNPY